MIAVSVAIPTLNRERELVNTLRFFVECADPHLHEIIVVDQSDVHDPATESYLRYIAHRIVYVRVQYKNLPKARNEAVKRASGDIILFVDDDVEPTDGFVSAHAGAYAEPSVMGVSGPVLDPGQRCRDRNTFPEDFDAAIAKGYLHGYLAKDAAFRYTPSWLQGCNMSYRRGCIERAGWFDETFFSVADGEDVDLSSRVRDQCGRLVYEPNASLVHIPAKHGGCRDEQNSARRMRDHVANSLYYMYKVDGRALVVRKTLDHFRTTVLAVRSGPWLGARIRAYIGGVRLGLRMICRSGVDLRS